MILYLPLCLERLESDDIDCDVVDADGVILLVVVGSVDLLLMMLLLLLLRSLLLMMY